MKEHHSHPVTRDTDMRTYLAKRNRNYQDTTVPPRQPTDICDQCGDIVATISLSQCPYCNYSICGINDYCFHYCTTPDDKIRCRYKKCDILINVDRIFCSNNCTMLHRNSEEL